MSSGKPPEFFFDRGLGEISAARLREAGSVIHLIADHFPDDAQAVADEDWIAEGCSRGWVLLTEDKRIRYRAQELAALRDGFLFCLADGNADLQTIVPTFQSAMPAIGRAVDLGKRGFWHVHANGGVRLMWP